MSEMLRDLRNRVMLTVARGVVTLVNDALKMQTVQAQLLKREVRDGIERFQNYGWTSKPHPGAEGVFLFVGGNRDHGLCIAVDDRRYRLTGLADGEVAIYTDEGDKIHLKRGRVAEVETETLRINAGTKVEINTPVYELNAGTSATVTTALHAIDAPLSTFSGDVQADGDILDNASGVGSTMATMRGVYNSHTHDGVQTGIGNTGDPNQSM